MFFLFYLDRIFLYVFLDIDAQHFIINYEVLHICKIDVFGLGLATQW